MWILSLSDLHKSYSNLSWWEARKIEKRFKKNLPLSERQVKILINYYSSYLFPVVKDRLNSCAIENGILEGLL